MQEIDKKISELQTHKEADIKAELAQNNVQININLSDLSALAMNNPELANKYISMLEKEQSHKHKIDDEILALEKKEQAIREEEIPHIKNI